MAEILEYTFSHSRQFGSTVVEPIPVQPHDPTGEIYFRRNLDSSASIRICLDGPDLAVSRQRTYKDGRTEVNTTYYRPGSANDVFIRARGLRTAYLISY